MKKLLSLLLFGVVLLSSCNAVSSLVSEELVEHTLPTYGVSIPASEDWEALDRDTEFDLYLGEDNGTLYFGVFGYHDADLAAEGLTPAALFDTQNEILLKDCENITDLREETVEAVEGRTLYSRICQGTKGEMVTAYYFGMSDLNGVLVWFVGTTNTTLIKLYDDVFDDILAKIKEVS